MAWTTLPTYINGNALTGAQLNAIADNIEETAVAKATTQSQYFVASGPNALVARTVQQDIISNDESTASTSFGSLGTVGPTVTMTTGTQALVWINAYVLNDTTAAATYTAVDVSGATTTAAHEERGMTWQGTANNGERWSACNLYPLTPGSNTFRMHYKVGSNTGWWKWRREQVMGF